MLIGIIGAKQSGKDTLTDYIISGAKERGLFFKRRGFADNVYTEVSEAVKVPVTQIRQSKSLYRPLLQVWGTEFRRKLYGENYWVEQLDAAIKQDDVCLHGHIIPDVRFQNEYDYIADNGGVLIKVWRCKNSVLSRLYTRIHSVLADSHESEQNWMEFETHFEFYNSSTLKNVHDWAYDFVEMISTRDDLEAIPGFRRNYTVPTNASKIHPHSLPSWEVSPGV